MCSYFEHNVNINSVNMRLLIVPARSGSKRIKDKNIRVLNNYPMLVHSLKIAKKAKLFDKIHLSTDSEKYIKIAKKFGFQTDFKRNKKFCRDKTPVLDAVKSDLIKFKKLGYKFQEICILSSTSPLINYKDLLNSRKIFLKFKKKFPVISVSKYQTKIERALKMINGKLVFKKKKYIKKNTQSFSDSYFATGNIFYYDSTKLLNNSNYNFKYLPYIIDTLRAIDIDDEVDLNLTKKIYRLL